MSKEPDIFEQYWRHASILRSWFIAFGIGGVILFISNPSAFESLSSDFKKSIIILFLVGVLLQILLALLNKITHWYEYYGEKDKLFQETKRYKWSIIIANTISIDIITDLFTFGFFLTAVAKLLIAIL